MENLRDRKCDRRRKVTERARDTDRRKTERLETERERQREL